MFTKIVKQNIFYRFKKLFYTFIKIVSIYLQKMSDSYMLCVFSFLCVSSRLHLINMCRRIFLLFKFPYSGRTHKSRWCELFTEKHRSELTVCLEGRSAAYSLLTVTRKGIKTRMSMAHSFNGTVVQEHFFWDAVY